MARKKSQVQSGLSRGRAEFRLAVFIGRTGNRRRAGENNVPDDIPPATRVSTVEGLLAGFRLGSVSGSGQNIARTKTTGDKSSIKAKQTSL